MPFRRDSDDAHRIAFGMSPTASKAVIGGAAEAHPAWPSSRTPDGTSPPIPDPLAAAGSDDAAPCPDAAIDDHAGCANHGAPAEPRDAAMHACPNITNRTVATILFNAHPISLDTPSDPVAPLTISGMPSGAVGPCPASVLHHPENARADARSMA